MIGVLFVAGIWLCALLGGAVLGGWVVRRRWQRYHVRMVSQLSNEVLALQRRPREVTVTRIGPPLSSLRVDIDDARYSIPSADWTERCDRVADLLVLHFTLPTDPDPGRPRRLSTLVDDNTDLQPVHPPAPLRAVSATDDPYRV